jgi:peptide/nickel transport system substrate-binding protein
VSHRGRHPDGWRRLALGLVLLALAGVLTACGPSGASAKPPPVTYLPGQGGIITVGIDQAPTGCNPNTATGDTVADRLVLSAVLPSAFSVDETGAAQYSPLPGLILSAELQSTTPETVVYTLNPRAVWSDGVPITASDFIYAWEHQRSVPINVTGGDANVATTAGYDDIATMTPSNQGRTLTVVFSTAYADWQSLFGDLLPAHILDKAGWSPDCDNVNPAIDLSGGPFEIATVSKTAITLVRNPHWWGTAPKVNELRFRIATGPTQLAEWLREGEIDVAAPSYFTPGFLAAVSSLPTVKSDVHISNTFLELEFATAGPLTSQTLLRDAVAYAIDRQQLTDRVVGWADGYIAPATSHLYAQSESAYPTTPVPVPVNATTTTTTTTVPTATPISATTFPTGADPDIVIQDMISAGYFRNASGDWVNLDGQLLTLKLAVDAGDGWAAQTAPLLVEQLKVEGITVQLIDEPDAAAAGEQLQAGNVDLALIPLHTTPFPSAASAWYSPLLDFVGGTGAQDWSDYNSTKVDNLFTQASSQLNPVTAQPLYNEIDAQLWADMVALPLFAEPDVLAWTDFVTGMTAGSYAPGLLSTILDWARLVKEPATYSGTPTVPPGGGN